VAPPLSVGGRAVGVTGSSSSPGAAISLASSATSLSPPLLPPSSLSSERRRLVVELHRTTALSLLAGGNCPLQMRFGLHDAAGGGFFLRVRYALLLQIGVFCRCRSGNCWR
jgi:hypothetical protein